MRVLDLFSGIGGFSLGLERAGMQTIGFCEIDPYCRRVLARHWPDVPCHDDIRTFDDLPDADIVCGGFPCQDISSAADAPVGIGGARSGLWKEFAGIIRAVRPTFAIVENVSALRLRGLSTVLGDLASIGYDAEWHCIPASAVGAPHPRDRIWIVAYSKEVFGPWISRYKPGGIISRDGLLAVLDDKRRQEQIPDWWAAEPGVGRVVHGVSARVDRLGCLSNAVVPQVVEAIGHMIQSIVL
jgi:DNA (cytosine-5)-methyltransferase 1